MASRLHTWGIVHHSRWSSNCRRRTPLSPCMVLIALPKRRLGWLAGWLADWLADQETDWSNPAHLLVKQAESPKRSINDTRYEHNSTNPIDSPLRVVLQPHTSSPLTEPLPLPSNACLVETARLQRTSQLNATSQPRRLIVSRSTDRPECSQKQWSRPPRIEAGRINIRCCTSRQTTSTIEVNNRQGLHSIRLPLPHLTSNARMLLRYLPKDA